MEALWQRSPMTAEDIMGAVASRQDWTEGTVKTLLNRLLTKGAIGAQKDGRRYLYRPLLDRAAYLTDESESLLDRLFNGRISAMVTHFSERERLTPDDIAELKRLIGDIDNER